MIKLAIAAVIALAATATLTDYDLRAQQKDLIRMYETYISTSCAIPTLEEEEEI